MEQPKKSMVVGCKWIFKRKEDILRIEELMIKLAGLQSVVGCKDSKQWLEAVNEEMHSLEKNQTEKPVGLPRIVGCKWRLMPSSRFKQ